MAETRSEEERRTNEGSGNAGSTKGCGVSVHAEPEEGMDDMSRGNTGERGEEWRGAEQGAGTRRWGQWKSQRKRG
eukprot:gene9281-biopygen8464